MKKRASQASWALITSEITGVRVEVHRLQQLLRKAQEVLGTLDQEEVYAAGGDLIKAIPELVQGVGDRLDKVSYALSILGEDYLHHRLSIDDRMEVETSLKGAPDLLAHRRKKI